MSDTVNGDTIELVEIREAGDRRTWTRIRFPSVCDLVEDEKLAVGKKDADKADKKKMKGAESKTSLIANSLLRGAQSGDLLEVQDALRNRADVNEPDEYGKTALHHAVLGNYVEIVSLLLSNGANAETSDETGETPIHSATRNGNETILKMLLKKGRSNVNVRNEENITPFHIAADIDHLVICKMLVEAGEVDINPRANDGTTPAAKAATMGNEKIVDYILTLARLYKADLREFLYNVDKNGSSLLQLAVNGGSKKAVEYCLQSGTLVRQPKTSDGSTAFHDACGSGSFEMVELLASYDPEVTSADLVDKLETTPLHRAAKGENVQIVEFLLEGGATVNPRDNTDKTPLFMAASSGETETVELLMEKGADITMKDVEKSNVLHAAMGQTLTEEALLRDAASTNLITDKDETGHAPIHYTARKGYAKIADMFLKKNKAAGLVASDDMNTPLHICAQFGHLEVAVVLHNKHYMRAPNALNSDGRTALHFACAAKDDAFVDFLISEGVALEKDKNDRTPLHVAAQVGSWKCVKSVVLAYPESINLLDKNKNTALHLAAMNGYEKIVSFLLSHNNQHILKNDQDQDVLDLAIALKEYDVAMEIANHDRWREIITGNSKGVIKQLQLLVEKMPDVAEKFLDRCVTEEGDPSDNDFKVTYDLTLVQGKGCPKTPKVKDAGLWTINTMLELRRDNCLTHPVCFSLLSLKWKKYGCAAFFVNLSIYLLFILPFTSLTILVKSREGILCAHNATAGQAFHAHSFKCTKNDNEIFILHWFMILVTSLSLGKEVYEFLKKRLEYITSPENYVEVSGYVLALVYLLPVCECKSFHKPEVGAFAVFIGWMILMMYFRRLSFYGTYVIMVLTMFKTLLEVLFLLALFMITFSTAFFILMENHVPYQSFANSFLNNFAMTLGELNYKDTFFEGSTIPYPVAMNVLFIIFVLTMPIIMMNMLIGLAVGDIDKIQQNAAMSRYVMQVELLQMLESSLPEWIIQRAHVGTFTKYPNAKRGLMETLYNKTVGFGRPEDEEPPPVAPQMLEMKVKVEEQEKKIDAMYEMLKQQSKILRDIGQQLSGQDHQKKPSEEGEEKKKTDLSSKLIGWL